MVLLDERPEVKAVAQATPGASEMMAQALPSSEEGGVCKNWDRVIRDRSYLQKRNGRRT